jgi:hypothetical protein
MMDNQDDISGGGGMRKNPVKQLHNLWHRPGKGGKKTIDLASWHGKVEDWVVECMSWSTNCIDVYTQQETKCTCLYFKIDCKEEKSLLAGYLVEFAQLKPSRRQ